ncbi:MAG: hypothetical protein IKI21_01805 [Oscillospiraceae bacterium]|nr:hypothetical protein [Oscillospiraceae bacterium]
MKNDMMKHALRTCGALMIGILCAAAGGCSSHEEVPMSSVDDTTEAATTLSPSEVKEEISGFLSETTAAPQKITAVSTENGTTAATDAPAATGAPAADPNAPTDAPADPNADPNAPAEQPQGDTGPQPGDVMPAVGASNRLADKAWLAHADDGTDRYFTFYDDHNGSYRDQETGDGLSFTYELHDDGTAVFHIADRTDNVEVTWADNGTAYLLWNGTWGETIRQIRNSASEPLDFFPNVQLCEMALNYYQAHNGYRPAAAEAMINYDEKIAIQLYDDMDGHTATSDWYTVDRYTATGTNILGEPIDLKAP